MPEKSELDTSDENFFCPGYCEVTDILPDTIRKSEKKPNPKEFNDFITCMCTGINSWVKNL